MMHTNTTGGEFKAVNPRAPPYVPPPPARSPDFFWQGPTPRGHLTRSESSQTLPVDSGVEHYRRPGKQNPPSYYDAIRTRHSLSHQGDGTPPDSRYYHNLQQQKYNSLPRPLPQRYSQFHVVQVEPPIVNGHSYPQEPPGKNWGSPASQDRPEDPRVAVHGRRGVPSMNGTSAAPLHQSYNDPQVNGFGKPAGGQADRDPYLQQNQHYQWTKTRIIPQEGLQGNRIHHARGNSEPQLTQRNSLPPNLHSYSSANLTREAMKESAPSREAECPTTHPELTSRKSDPVLKTPTRDPWRVEYPDVRRQAIHVPPRQAVPFPQSPPHPFVGSSPDRLSNLEWPLGSQVPPQAARNRCQPRPPIKNISNNLPPPQSGAIRPAFTHPTTDNHHTLRKVAALSPNESGSQPNEMDSPNVAPQRCPPQQDHNRQAVVPNVQPEGSTSKGKASSLASPSPWEREEKEKMRTKQLEKARRTRDHEIKKLEKLPNRTPRQEELLRTLQLEREFQRRAEEAHEDEDDEEEDDDSLLERAETRERQLMLQNEMERSRVQRLEKKIEELVRTKNQPLSPQEEWARRRMRQQLTQISEETDHQKNDPQARGHHRHHHHHRNHSNQQNRDLELQQPMHHGVQPQHANQENCRLGNGDVMTSSSQMALKSPCPASSPSSLSPPSSLNSVGEDNKQEPSRANYHQNNGCIPKMSPSADFRPTQPKGKSPAIPPRARNCIDVRNHGPKQTEENNLRSIKSNSSYPENGLPCVQERQIQRHSEVLPQRGEIVRNCPNDPVQPPPMEVLALRGARDYILHKENHNKFLSVEVSDIRREDVPSSYTDLNSQRVSQRGETDISSRTQLQIQQASSPSSMSEVEQHTALGSERCRQYPLDTVLKNGTACPGHNQQLLSIARDPDALPQPQHYHQRALRGDTISCHYPQQKPSLEVTAHKAESSPPSRPANGHQHLPSEPLALRGENPPPHSVPEQSRRQEISEPLAPKGHPNTLSCDESNQGFLETATSRSKESTSAAENSAGLERNKRPLSEHTWTAKPIYLQSGTPCQESANIAKSNMEVQKTSSRTSTYHSTKGRDWMSDMSRDALRGDDKRRDQQKLWESRPERLSFHEKVRKFAMQSGEADLPKDKVKHSRAQREIENKLNGVVNIEESTKG